MSASDLCKHCNFLIAQRNPSGFCDHLYYPENCEICRKYFVKKDSELNELLASCKEFVQWFDYLAAYQHENLVNGQTLKTASENWENMQTPNPSPSIERMRKAIAAIEAK